MSIHPAFNDVVALHDGLVESAHKDWVVAAGKRSACVERLEKFSNDCPAILRFEMSGSDRTQHLQKLQNCATIGAIWSGGPGPACPAGSGLIYFDRDGATRANLHAFGITGFDQCMLFGRSFIVGFASNADAVAFRLRYSDELDFID